MFVRTLIGIAVLSSCVVAMGEETQKIDRGHLVEEARRSTQFVERRIDRLSEAEVVELSSLYGQIFDVLKSGKPDVVCLESTQNKGKFCLKSLSSNDNLCLGNYFSSNDNCQKSLNAIRKDKACYESKDNAGKALVSKIEVNITGKIGNYYLAFEDCVEAMTIARREFVCEPSESKAPKWFIANLETAGGDSTGNYYSNKDNCFNAMKAAKRNYVCMESNNDNYRGKWFIGNMEKDGDREGPYLGSLEECRDALKRKALPLEVD